jgi:DNA-directed RNA polymerase specialized sigma24 family protein
MTHSAICSSSEKRGEAVMAGTRDASGFEALLNNSRETIEGIIRRTLRVTLSTSDGRADNEDAFDVKQAVELQLWEKYLRLEESANDDRINNFRGYAAVVTYHVCYDFLRDKYPEWYSLKNRLRYFLENNNSFAVWENADQELLCGFVGWQNRKQVIAQNLQFASLQDLQPNKHIQQMKAAQWQIFFDSLFNQTDSPVRVDDLVHFVAELFGVKDEKHSLDGEADEEKPRIRIFELVSQQLSPEQEYVIGGLLRRLWAEICQLRPNQRKAYLLNFADGDIEVFPCNAIATICEIGATLEISDQQFAALWLELLVEDDRQRDAKEFANYDEKFIFLWLFLPLKDAAIAHMLGGTVSQVAGLRRLARESLKKRLETYAAQNAQL